eukprot:6334272-Pyramimonas_sp.AAC.1
MRTFERRRATRGSIGAVFVQAAPRRTFHQPCHSSSNIASFYGSSCADNGKGALPVPTVS